MQLRGRILRGEGVSVRATGGGQWFLCLVWRVRRRMRMIMGLDIGIVTWIARARERAPGNGSAQMRKDEATICLTFFGVG